MDPFDGSLRGFHRVAVPCHALGRQQNQFVTIRTSLSYEIRSRRPLITRMSGCRTVSRFRSSVQQVYRDGNLLVLRNSILSTACHKVFGSLVCSTLPRFRSSAKPVCNDKNLLKLRKSFPSTASYKDVRLPYRVTVSLVSTTGPPPCKPPCVT